MEEQKVNRKRGALMGLAVGDALGAAVEFREPGTFAPVTGYRIGGPHNLDLGQWTDDTSMALALADSIGKTGWNLDDQMKRYIDWWQEGKYSVNGWCFDIGCTTRTALQNYIGYGTEEQVGNVWACADKNPDASGNGSIMRLAPVAIKYADLYPNNIRLLCRYAEESSLTTHASDQCRSACKYLAVVLAGLIHGESRDLVLSPDWSALEYVEENGLDQQIRQVISMAYFRNNVDIVGSGWVVKSLEAALWAFRDSNSFEEAVLKAVNLGNDADTTGAICGQLAGAYWGESGIPLPLREGLDKKNMLEEALASIL